MKTWRRRGAWTTGLGILTVLFAALMAPAALTAGVDAWAAKAGSEAELYRQSCAGCHGVDGKGLGRETVGFDVPLPDFSDCNFASREPDADWGAIIHSGGPVRAFDRMMPAFGKALSMDEIGMILRHVRSFCADDAWPSGNLNLPRALVTEKAFPEDEAVFTSAIATEGDGSVWSKIVYESRFGARNQWELIVPFGWKEQQVEGAGPGQDNTDWEGGIGDIAVGAKRAVWHSMEKGSIFSIAGEVILPTGDQDEGLGSGITKLEPFVSFGHLLPADGFLQIQVGAEIPLDDEVDNEGFWRLVLGRSFAEKNFGRTWSPMVEVLGAKDLVSGATTHWDIVPQVQVTLNTRQHIMADIGIRLPLNESGNRDTQLLFYLLWDWFDGGFFDGW